MTPVLFRADRRGEFKGDITAVLPTMPASTPILMTCYARVGQHSVCSHEWYRKTRPATKAEYAPLLRELKRVYGDLKVYRRLPRRGARS